MRLSSVLIRVGTFGLAAALATAGATMAVTILEYRSKMVVQEALLDAEMSWARVIGDGLQVILEGEAPNEVARLRAVNVAGGVVDASRVISNMSVADEIGIAAPEFTIEILRNDSGVYLIGLIPASTDRDDLTRRIGALSQGKPVSDLLEGADYPVPDEWRSSLNFSLRALEILPRSKISVAAGAVEITASADSPEQKRSLEQRIRQMRPETVSLTLKITAPRPVVTPFITRFIIEDGEARFEACTADTEAARDTIVAAAEAEGYTGTPNCTIALGTPSRTWGEAVAKSIAALGDLGGGTLTVTDADIVLVAPEGTDQATFDEVIGALDNSLPDLFALDASIPEAPVVVAGGPSRFTAILSEDGKITIRGRLPDDLTNTLVENYARAKFSGDEVVMGTIVAEGLPADWQVRVLAGLDALSDLSDGSVTVEPGSIRVSGNTGDENANTHISGLLVDKLGESADFSVDVNYVPQEDNTVDEVTPEDCLAQIVTVTDGRKITFDPGSTSLSSSAQPIIDDIAEVMRQCVDVAIEVAGYTDSQGGEEMNQRLSQNRAQAVLDALRMRRIPTSSFVATGYGEADPIADNGTEEGREANRRIEFHLVQPEPEAPATEGEVTEETPADAAPAEEETSQ